MAAVSVITLVSLASVENLMRQQDHQNSMCQALCESAERRRGIAVLKAHTPGSCGCRPAWIDAVSLKQVLWDGPDLLFSSMPQLGHTSIELGLQARTLQSWFNDCQLGAEELVKV